MFEPTSSRLERFHRRLAATSGCDLAGIVGRLLPPRFLRALESPGTRRRFFTRSGTFWLFLCQTLTPQQSCREVVRRAQAERVRRRRSPMSPGTAGYCLARRRLPLPALQDIWCGIATELDRRGDPGWLWHGMRVAVTDGTTTTMPDTPANQKCWPQPRSQKPGCGFPIMKIVAVFALATGAIHAVVCNSMHSAEQAMLQTFWPYLQNHFDLLLGDRNFGSYATFCELQTRRMHGVFRLHQGRRMDWRSGRRLGRGDRLVTWQRPPKLPPTCRRKSLPDTIRVRIVRVQVAFPGFRTQTIFLATDLTDPRQFPSAALADLYLQRWRVELFFAHIKTSMHMDVLRCLSPHMIRRELHMHLVAYNAIRALMLDTARSRQVPLDRVSFKGTCDALRQFAPHLAVAASHPATYRRLLHLFLDSLAEDLVPLRRPRSEPRAVKRRPKNYHRLTKPRHEMGNLPHRNRGKAAS